ncbi:hypothetical protein D9758_016913 [Tetrapyrgos nigripes]|uniref:SH3 domain-containing protein n=1 Tax=Tetrapyrgos nigripes TaxID=182062 RepID=A0A8H5FG08_9AGAR|nr:hypothetical protein D9758_016913 [Tetrapyrgos nigripes]
MPESSVKHPPPGLPLGSPPRHQKKLSNSTTPTPMSPAFTPTTPTPHNYESTPTTTTSKSRPTSLATTTTTTTSRPSSLTASNATPSNPSTPSSPAFFQHKPNRDSTASNVSGISTLSSSRPAPPSPAMSRRTSTMGDAPPTATGLLSRSNSNAGAGGGKRKSGRESLGTASAFGPGLPTQDENSEVADTTITPTHLPPNHLPKLPQFPNQTQSHILLRASIKIRDFAYPEDDPRFWGRGLPPDDGVKKTHAHANAHVPKQNRLRVLNKALMGEEGYRLWKEERRRMRAEVKEDKETPMATTTTPDHRRTSLAWSSASEASGFADDDDDDDGGWGGGGGGSGFKFGMGRFSWTIGSGSSSSATRSGFGTGERTTGGPGAGYPTRKDLARNFGGGGVGMEDSSGESDDTEEDESQDGVFYDAQDGNEEYYDQDEETYSDTDDPDPPLYPGLYRSLYAFEPEGSAELPLVENQIVRVVGRGGGVGWAVVLKGSWTLGEDGIWKNEPGSDVGHGGNGEEKHGLVPESYLEPVRLDLDDEE